VGWLRRNPGLPVDPKTDADSSILPKALRAIRCDLFPWWRPGGFGCLRWGGESCFRSSDKMVWQNPGARL